MWLIVGEDCIIVKFYFIFKTLVNFYIARNRLDLSGSLPTSASKKLALEVSNFPSWKLPNDIVPYDTYIIFEENLGAILFVKNLSKNINTF